MNINVYIFGMEMSQRIHFWYQISLKMSIVWKTKGIKNHIFGKKILRQATKNHCDLNMLETAQKSCNIEVTKVLSLPLVQGGGGGGQIPWDPTIENHFPSESCDENLRHIVCMHFKKL